jgi:3-deoxy-manno-octulosonate cytidylyltransferase (CMP-KDO synthetase)
MLRDKPVIQWVYERASRIIPRVVVATDDKRIMNAVNHFGGQVLLTSTRHGTGTERCAEALELFSEQTGNHVTHVMNIQGDEPLLHREHLEKLMACMRLPETGIGTLVRPIMNLSELADPNVVKAVIDRQNRALYFSRAPIPHERDGHGVPGGAPPRFAHLGLYAFRTEVLKDLVKLPPTPLETAESLEQLRWLEHGYTIHVGITVQPSMGVDTPEDLERIRSMIENGEQG